MIDDSGSDAERFYRERDRRTSDYLRNGFPVHTSVSVHASHDACESRSGQLILVTLVNQLARIHRQIHIALAAPYAPLLTPDVCGGSNLGDEISRLACRIDPFGKFDVDGEQGTPNKISIGIGGQCQPGLNWYLGCNRSVAAIARTPCVLGSNVSADLRGAGLAALLGAAAVTKCALGIDTAPTTLSAWNLKDGVDAAVGPESLPRVDVGQGLMIGAGAVASAAVYWLKQWGSKSTWAILDRDQIKLHNTNRCLLFFPDQAAQPNKRGVAKALCLAQHLPDAVGVCEWYHQTQEARQSFDMVLVLANEFNVRTLVSSRNDPIQLQATTGRSWLSQLHRHIVGRDGCVRCRMSDIRTPQFSCSEASTATAEQPTRPDAALPFLSAASGLMLVTAMQRLQLKEFGANETNVWNWDFRNSLRMDSSGRYACRNDCSTILAPNARKRIAARTRWKDAPWLPITR